MSKFTAGNQFGKGRPVGSKNKASDKLRRTFTSFLLSEFKSAKSVDLFYESLSNSQRVKFLFEILPFCLPKLQAQNLTPSMDAMTDEQVQELYDRIMKAV